MLFNSDNISYMEHVFQMVMAEEQDVKSNQANIFRASAHVMFTIVPLAKVSHVTKADAHEARTFTYFTSTPCKITECRDKLLIRGGSKEWGH